MKLKNIKIFSILFAFVMLLGLVPFNIAKAEGEFEYIGYSVLDYRIPYTYAIVKENGEEFQIVYCYNSDLVNPPNLEKATEGELRYKKITDAEAKDFDEALLGSEGIVKGDKLKNALLKVLVNGYPNGKILNKKLNLTDKDFNLVTQFAVRYLTDNKLNDVYSSNIRLARAILIDQAGGTLPEGELNNAIEEYKQNEDPNFEMFELHEVPENATLNLFINNGVLFPYSDTNYQNLLSATIVDKNTGDPIIFEDTVEEKSTTVKFSKEDIEGNELTGATITLTNSDGEVLEEWVSDGTTKEFELSEGSYKFTETATPEGYKVATEITFDVIRNEETKELEVSNVVIGEGNRQEGDVLIMVDDYETPEVPEEPEPETPEVPEEPEPETTEVPEEPEPETPEVPEEPEPETPKVPEEPKPETPVKPQEPKPTVTVNKQEITVNKPVNTKNPNTGDLGIGLYLGAMILSGAGYVSLKRKKDKIN